MDHESDNFTAEMLLKQLGASVSVPGTTAGGAAVVRQALDDAGVPLGGVVIADGSGLSLLDRTTPRALEGLLEAAWNDPALRGPFTQALAVAGVNGTLEDRMRRAPARGNVLAKTGTTNLASALSGFAGGRYAFSVVQNGRPIYAYWARDRPGPLRDRARRRLIALRWALGQEHELSTRSVRCVADVLD